MLAEEKAWVAIGLDGSLDNGLEGVFARPDHSKSDDLARDPAPVIEPYEAALVARLRSGEIEAFAELVRTYQPLVFSLTLRVVNDEEEARDVSQETFLKIYRHFARFRGESSLKTWVCRIAINQAHNSQRWWRRRRRQETCSLDEATEDREPLSARLPSLSESPEAQALSHERYAQMERALAELKQDFRMAVVLRDIEGMSYDEIAAILEISVGTVKSRIARGREMLRARLS